LLRPAPLRGVSKPETTLSGAAVLHEIHREFVDVTLVMVALLDLVNPIECGCDNDREEDEDPANTDEPFDTGFGHILDQLDDDLKDTHSALLMANRPLCALPM
jgi:hypothetical protein